METSSLLKAIERSLRHRSRKPFVSMDRAYCIAPRSPNLSKRSRSIKVQNEPADRKSSRPRSGEIVDWPESSSTSIASSVSPKRGSLYEEDVAISRRNAKHYAIEVREPTLRDLRDHRLSGYYRGDAPEERSEPNEGSSIGIENDINSGNPETSDVEILAKIPWDYDSDDELLDGSHEAMKAAFRNVQSTSMEQEDVSDDGDASSEPGSVFSLKSLASSATNISKGSGFSPVQIATATLELLSIFQDDEVLQPLYTAAIHGRIGPRRFKKKFRRLLKTYSENLKEEATESLDLLAARLVAYRANHVAEAITEKYQTSLAPTLDDEENLQTRVKNDSLSKDTEQEEDDHDEDEDQEDVGVDESVFEKLTDIRAFLVGSAALSQLRTSLQHFVFPPRVATKQSSTEVSKSKLEVELELLGLSQSLLEIVLATPRSNLRVCSTNNTSVLNRTKAAAEDYTRLEWDWWPLSPRIPDIEPGQSRLEWTVRRPLQHEVTSRRLTATVWRSFAVSMHYFIRGRKARGYPAFNARTPKILLLLPP